MRTAGVGVFCLWFFWLHSATGQNEPRLIINQAYAELPSVTAYFDYLDDAGQPLDDPPTAVEGTLGTEVLDWVFADRFDRTGEGVSYLFLVDVSKTLTEREFVEIRTALRTWIDDLGEEDRAAIVSFGQGVETRQAFTSERDALVATAEGLGPTDNLTQLYPAIREALLLYRDRARSLPARRVIIVLSDGKHEGTTPVTLNQIEGLIDEYPIPIYSIGYSRLKPPERSEGLSVLARLSDLSGGVFFEADQSSTISQLYATMRLHITRAFVATFACNLCQGDGTPQRLRVTANGVSHDRNVRVFPATQTSTESFLWPIVAAIGVVVALLGLAFVWFRRKEPDLVQLPEREPVYPSFEPEVVSSPPEPPAPSFEVTLIVVRGAEPRQEIRERFAERLVVGSRGADVEIAGDENLSPRHFELIKDDDGLFVQDCGTQTGTAVNGVTIRNPYKLARGDLVTAGSTELRILFRTT